MIAYSTQLIEEDDIRAVEAAMRRPHLTQGGEVAALEEEIAAYIGTKEAVLFNSATTALLALYTALELGEGDEVITTPISFVATTNMFVALGAKPIWCDVRRDGNIDESRIERLITPRTKAIVAVDFGGKSVEQDRIAQIAKAHSLFYIDDACHAFGSVFNGQKVGSLADASIFSFHAIKPITTMEGGCVVTNDAALSDELRLIRSHGMVKKRLWQSDMVRMGYNFRLSDVAAALGRSQLRKIDRFLRQREEIASYYEVRFGKHQLFTTQKIEANRKSTRHLYPLLLIPKLHCRKEEIFSFMQQKGLGVQVHYRPIYQNSFYRSHFGEVELPVAEDFYKSEISIPCHQGMDLEQAQKVADIVLEAVEKYEERGDAF